MDGKSVTSTLTPSIVYDDAKKGIQWLTDVLGFQLASHYEDPHGGIAFAELVWRTGVIFVSGRPPKDNPWSGTGPSSIALAAESRETVDRCYERAIAANAEIIRPVHDARTPAFPDGSYQFDLRDPEGNLWTLGTFQPRISIADR